MATTNATADSLRKLLLELAQQDAGLAARAEAELHAAAYRYLLSKPDLDAAGNSIRSGVSADRAAVRKVAKKAAELQEAIAAMSVHVRFALGSAMDAPLGTLTLGLEALSKAIPGAVQQLQGEEDKPSDSHLNVWAYDVALVLRDVLNITPTRTRDDVSTQHVRGGAAYARLIEQAHLLIGRRSRDWGRLIDAGVTLLKDPTGDHVN